MHGRAPNGCDPDDVRVAPSKVLIPLVATRVEEADDATADGIDAGEVGSLAEIAALAGEREIVASIGAAVLAGKNVLDVMDQLAVPLPKETILAAITSAVPDQVASMVVQGLGAASAQLPPRFALQDRNEVRGIDDGFVFGALVVGQETFVRALGECADAFLNLRGNLKLGDAARGFGVQAAAEWVEQTFERSGRGGVAHALR
jgi:hypothetical protein